MRNIIKYFVNHKIPVNILIIFFIVDESIKSSKLLIDRLFHPLHLLMHLLLLLLLQQLLQLQGQSQESGMTTLVPTLVFDSPG